MTLSGNVEVGMIAVEVESKPAPFENRKACGTQTRDRERKSRSLTRIGRGLGITTRWKLRSGRDSVEKLLSRRLDAAALALANPLA